MIPAYSRSQRHSQADIHHPIDHNHLHSHQHAHQHHHQQHSNNNSNNGSSNHYIQDKDSRLIWERKLVANEMSDYERTNSLEDEYATSNNANTSNNMKMVPIIYEKQKSCTCNSMHGTASSMRQSDNNPPSSVYGSRKQSPVHHASCKAATTVHASSNGLGAHGNNKCRLCGSKSFINNNNEPIEMMRQGDKEMITLNDRVLSLLSLIHSLPKFELNGRLCDFKMNRLSQIDLARSTTSLHVNPNKPLPVYPIGPTNPIKLSSIK